eukprot:1493651-Rhodomonas_salina.1
MESDVKRLGVVRGVGGGPRGRSRVVVGGWRVAAGKAPQPEPRRVLGEWSPKRPTAATSRLGLGSRVPGPRSESQHPGVEETAGDDCNLNLSLVRLRRCPRSALGHGSRSGIMIIMMARARSDTFKFTGKFVCFLCGMTQAPLARPSLTR